MPWLFVLCAAVMIFGGCCPDRGEVCNTPKDWPVALNCPDFPAAPEGAQCPSADAVAKTCSADITSLRVAGDRCCYDLPAECL